MRLINFIIFYFFCSIASAYDYKSFDDFKNKFKPPLTKKESAQFRMHETPMAGNRRVKRHVEFFEDGVFRNASCRSGAQVIARDQDVIFLNKGNEVVEPSPCVVKDFERFNMVSYTNEMKLYSISFGYPPKAIVIDDIDMNGKTIYFDKTTSGFVLARLGLGEKKYFLLSFPKESVDDDHSLLIMEDFELNGAKYPKGTKLHLLDGQDLTSASLPKTKTAEVEGIPCIGEIHFIFDRLRLCELSKDQKIEDMELQKGFQAYFYFGGMDGPLKLGAFGPVQKKTKIKGFTLERGGCLYREDGAWTKKPSDHFLEKAFFSCKKLL